MRSCLFLQLALLVHGSAALLVSQARCRRGVVSMAAALPEGEKVAVVLLAGGSGSRMKANMPKQFLELNGRPVLQHSLELLTQVQQLETLVLVINEEFRELPFLKEAMARDKRIVFAAPGAERQDSVNNGLEQVPTACTLVAIHDSARPLVTLDDIHKCLADGCAHGAAVLAVPMKATVKQSDDGQFVAQTLDRSKLWEIQTPQVLRPEVLREGFRKVAEEGWAVTDDVSIVERMGKPVKLTMGRRALAPRRVGKGLGARPSFVNALPPPLLE